MLFIGQKFVSKYCDINRILNNNGLRTNQISPPEDITAEFNDLEIDLSPPTKNEVD